MITTATKSVGICRTVFPCPSEAFIVEQANHLRRYSPTFVVGRLLEAVPFKSIAATVPGDLLRERMYMLSRSSHFFADRAALQQLPLLHAHFGPDGVYAMALAESLDIPLIVTYHGFEAVASKLALWLSREVMNYQFLIHENALKHRVSAIVVVSDFVRRRLLAKGYPAEKIVLHYIGVDTEKFSPARQKPDERYILSVGRHTRRKGIATLLTAFARIARQHPEVTLVQVGAGPLSAELHALAARLGIAERVRFLGAQPHGRVLELMKGAEIFSLPSQTSGSGDSEALGIVFNEASACAVPVVSTLHGGIPEAVLDGETGMLVPERDDRALADRLDILLRDRALARRMGQRGREYMLDQFDIRRQTADLEAIYDRFSA